MAAPSGIGDVVERILAPTTLLAALAYYFGYVYTVARARVLGLDPGLLGLSPQDYVLRSLDGFFVPLGAALLAALAGLAVHGLAERLDPLHLRDDRVLLVAGWALVGLGAVALLVGLQSAVAAAPWLSARHFLLRPLSPGLGLLALAYGSHLLGRRHRRTTMHRGAVVLVGAFVVMSLFWTASTYATALGRGRGLEAAQDWRALPRARVYSSTPLRLQARQVVRTTVARSGPLRYRYDGLRLLMHASGRWFLLPAGYQRGTDDVLLIDDTDQVRVELAPGGQ